jgi:hypothetical protein
MLYSEIGGKH